MYSNDVALLLPCRIAAGARKLKDDALEERTDCSKRWLESSPSHADDYRLNIQAVPLQEKKAIPQCIENGGGYR